MIKIDRASLDQEVYDTLFERSSIQEFRANEVVVGIGSMCNYLFFIEKGMLRNFYFDQKGNDITHWFACEDMITTVPPSFFNQEPSIFGIEAVENTTARVLTRSQLEEGFQRSIALERFVRLLTTNIMIALGKKIVALQTMSAEDRYDELIKTYPDIFRRAKLGHIAGYLGVKQQSLSRIRTLKRTNDQFLT
ncbi:MAG: cyclic nucleotide-binding domain-containing protein [Bacteroidota bacterium]